MAEALQLASLVGLAALVLAVAGVLALVGLDRHTVRANRRGMLPGGPQSDLERENPP